ncbi:helix-turn-helix transcriptional regulator [Burkholderia sola]|uniref:helix-turn-helix domain-containing protein n=1 Tax=Burkholderia TaxID=32008 RepID=UPI001AE33381|nr:helix-turn-helix transcriptional regulator [Burkholderia sp. AcTa6-5]MBP0714290.1 helix-turn-helix transcriptional regulator [Burkholderia sp. AcTa6-5]
MTAFSDAFRSEVLRMARKEIKGAVGGLRKTVATQRSEIAALKRDVKALTAQLKAVLRGVSRQDGASNAAPVESTDVPARRTRRFSFNAQALAAKREELGISQQGMAVLLEASTLSVSRWESGKVTPRAAQLERIQSVLKIGKREAKARLLG